MSTEKKSIFRQSTIDRMNTPEQLDQYLQVTKPSTWILLSAVIALLIGFLTWGCFGKLTTTIEIAIYSTEGESICFIPEEAYSSLMGKEIEIGGETYDLLSAGYSRLYVDTLPANVKLAGNLIDGMIVYPMLVNGDLSDGIYTGTMEIDQISPIKFILD